jgi:nucleoside-diphosphate-sugar epimerase
MISFKTNKKKIRTHIMNILVIGGSGHVSGSVVRAALAKGCQVWTVTRGTRPLIQGVKSIISDRHDHKTMNSAILHEETLWDMVVDCICYEPADMIQDIELFRSRAKQFVFISTDFVYDPATRRFPQPEETEHYAVGGTAGSPDYGHKKRLCELALLNSNTGDMGWTVLRPCHIYGPTSQLGCLPMHGRDPELIKKLRAGNPLKLVGGGFLLQQPLFVDDLANTILSITENKYSIRQTFHIAGPDIIESRQYYQIIADILNVKLTVEEIPVKRFLEENPGSSPFICHRIYDLAKLWAAGLQAPSTPIREGLRLHVEGLLNK